MKLNLEEKLTNDFPKILKDMHGNPNETCLAFGCECGDGWYDIIYNLCKDMQNYIDKSKCGQVRAFQIKEKFGSLRFYTHGAPEEIHKMIRDAENKSLNTCEVCGKIGELHIKKGWYRTRCKEHKL